MAEFHILDGNSDKIKHYAASMAKFLQSYHDIKLSTLGGKGQVSARIDGYDVDLKDDTLVKSLPEILHEVRKSIDALNLSSPAIVASITPCSLQHLDATVAKSCDYINMQNYDGGYGTSPRSYIEAVPGLRLEQLAW